MLKCRKMKGAAKNGRNEVASIAVYEKTAGLREWEQQNLNSAHRNL